VTTDTTLRPKHAGIVGKGYRLGGRDRSSSEMHPSHGVSESASSRRQKQHQVDRYAMLAAAERRADSTSQSKDEESHNEHERLLK